MDKDKQLQLFANELEGVINRYFNEFDLNYAEVIGVLTLLLSKITYKAFRNG